MLNLRFKITAREGQKKEKYAKQESISVFGKGI
jgi:hypothetical protein